MKRERFFSIPKKSDDDRGIESEEIARKAAQAWVSLRNESCYVVKVIALYAPTVVEITDKFEEGL